MNSQCSPELQHLAKQLATSSETLTERAQTLSDLKIFTSASGPAAERLKSDLRGLIWAITSMADRLQRKSEQLKRPVGGTDQHL